jgi:hypothetical protein
VNEIPLPTPGRTAIFRLGSTLLARATTDGNGGFTLRCGKLSKNAISADELQAFLGAINAKFECWE